MAAKTIKMCDMDKNIAVKILQMLNPGKITIKAIGTGFAIVTNCEPRILTYPEGWYYAKGAYTNKHKSSSGLYQAVPMMREDGRSWQDIATYCTLY